MNEAGAQKHPIRARLPREPRVRADGISGIFHPLPAAVRHGGPPNMFFPVTTLRISHSGMITAFAAKHSPNQQKQGNISEWNIQRTKRNIHAKGHKTKRDTSGSTKKRKRKGFCMSGRLERMITSIPVKYSARYVVYFRLYFFFSTSDRLNQASCVQHVPQSRQ